MNPNNMAALIQAETERRKILQDFIASHLVKDTDYGTIAIHGKESKPCLFKPGSEKFCSLLQLRAEFTKDEETISMLTNPGDVLALKCHLIHIPSGNVMAEGRGACSLKEKQGMVNTAIKIAEKRAQIDAVLRLGFSDSFTQDLEDMEEPLEPKTREPRQTLPVHTEPVKVENWQEVTLPFGKNKGKKLGEVEPAYLEWLSQNWTPNPKFNSTADQILKGALDAYRNNPAPYINEEPPLDEIDPSSIPF